MVEVSYLRWIVLLPLAGFLLFATRGDYLRKRSISRLACLAVLGSFVLSARAFSDLLAAGTLVDQVYTWNSVPGLTVDVTLVFDRLAAVMCMVVSGVGFLIHVYSTGYMAHDRGHARYFACLNLLTSAMLRLVLAGDLVLMFVGWEGVGLCSYLLIGFWYTDHEKASAGRKAFIVNRIGDAAFILGALVLYRALADSGTPSFRFETINAAAATLPPVVALVVALLLFAGATGKSAQLPLFVWLPDAMAGPTPVSALIHAATMVTAGVYMIARLSALYVAAPAAMTVVAVVGAATALLAATVACTQNDIKKVLAYSTVSQLGYMFMALGVGAFGAAVFHLVTHAFFKALLFLGAGSVIHALDEEQDIHRMGGLARAMPVTTVTFVVATAAIAGFPGLAGFFSKDAILVAVFASGGPLLWGVGLLGAMLTAFYMTRLVVLVFFGSPRTAPEIFDGVGESPPTMSIPLVVLAVLAAVGGYLGVPPLLYGNEAIFHFLAPVLAAVAHPVHLSHMTEVSLMAASVTAVLVAALVAWRLYRHGPDSDRRVAGALGPCYRAAEGAYSIDRFYLRALAAPLMSAAEALWRRVDVALIDRSVEGLAALVAGLAEPVRRLASGRFRDYALAVLIGSALLVLAVWKGGSF